MKSEEKEVNLWPDKLPADVKLEKGVKEQKMGEDDILRISKMPVPTLQKFNVKNTTRDKVMIICPGGGYSILAANHEGTEVAAWLNSLGYTAYVLRYRVPNNRLGALQDAQRAVREVRAQNPGKKIGIMGFSAGASLSCRTATRFETPAYAAFDEIDQQSCRPDFAALIYPAYLDQGENHSVTPELTLSEKTPPFFIFQTSDDGCGNSSLVFGAALRQNKLKFELHILPDGGHGYGLRTYKPGDAPNTWPRLMEKWMDKLDLK